MTKIIEAKAIISADDKTGPALKSILDKINSLSKAHSAFAKNGGNELSILGKHFAGLNKQVSAVDGFRAHHEALKQTRVQYRAAQDEVIRLGRAIKEAEKPTRSMTLEYERSQRAVKQAAAAFQEKVTAVKAAKAEMAAYGVTLANMNRKQAEAQRVLSTISTQPVSRPPRRAPLPGASVPPERSAPTPAPGQKRPEGSGLPVAEVAGSLAIGKTVKDTVMAGAKVDSERSQMRQSGWTDKEIGTAEHRANRLAAEWGVSPASAMNIIREARPTFGGDLQTTLKSVPGFFATRTAMKQKSPNASDEDLNNQLGQIIKSGEILGYSKDPKALSEYINFATQMAQTFGSGLRGEEWLNFAKSGKSAAGNASFEFLRAVMPTMLSEQGGDRLGTALQTMRGALLGGKMKHAAVKNLAALGLVDEENGVHRVPKTGEIKGLKPGGIKGSDVLGSNPLKWYTDYARPAMDKKGMTREERKLAIAGISSDRNVEYMLNLFDDNLDRMKKDQETVEKAKGVEGTKTALKDDPLLAGGRVKASAEGAMAALAQPIMEPLKSSADSAANALSSLADAARGNPNATTGGMIGGGILGGVGSFIGSAGTGLMRIPLIAAGAGGGALAGGLALPFLLQQAYPELKKKAEADTGYAFNRNGRGTPMGDGMSFTGYDDYGEQLRRRFQGADAPERPGAAAVDLSKVTAKVEQPVPVDVTGKVALDPSSKVDVNVSVKVQGPATVTGQSVSAGGNVKGSVGTSTAGNYE